MFARIDAVDASTIKRVANRFIYDKVMNENWNISYSVAETPVLSLEFPGSVMLQNLWSYDMFLLQDIAIAAMGPIQRLPDYNWFRRRTYWNRY